MKKEKIVDFLKVLFIASKTAVILFGMMILSILTIYAIVYLKSGILDDIEPLDLKMMVNTTRTAWLYIIVWLIFVTGSIVEGCITVYKIANKIRNTEGDLENKLKVTFGIRKEES